MDEVARRLNKEGLGGLYCLYPEVDEEGERGVLQGVRCGKTKVFIVEIKEKEIST